MTTDRDRADWDEATDSRSGDGEHHATTGGSALAGAVTGATVGGIGAGPIGAVVGAIGGAIVGATGERVMHSDDDHEGKQMGLDNDRDGNPFIEDRAKEMPTGTAGRESLTPTHATTGTAREGGSVQLREEELRARKTEVESGRVRVEKDIVTEQRSMDVPVTREEVVVERHAVDRRPSDRPISETGERDIEVTLHEERVDVEKRPVVYEEVSVGKREVTETERVSGTVRREVAEVHTEGDVDVDGGRTQPGQAGRL